MVVVRLVRAVVVGELLEVADIGRAGVQPLGEASGHVSQPFIEAATRGEVRAAGRKRY